jgi:hypothetical protein
VYRFDKFIREHLFSRFGKNFREHLSSENRGKKILHRVNNLGREEGNAPPHRFVSLNYSSVSLDLEEYSSHRRLRRAALDASASPRRPRVFVGKAVYKSPDLLLKVATSAAGKWMLLEPAVFRGQPL